MSPRRINVVALSFAESQADTSPTQVLPLSSALQGAHALSAQTLIVKVVIILHCSTSVGRATARTRGVRELEGATKAALLLQLLRKHLVLANVSIRHGAARELHRLLEMRACDLRHRVHVLLLHSRKQHDQNYHSFVFFLYQREFRRLH